MQVYWLTLGLVVMWIWVNFCGVRSSTTTSFQSWWVNKKVWVYLCLCGLLLWWLPVSCCSRYIHTQFLVIAAYLISSGFMSVYHMAVDTIFICASEFYLDEHKTMCELLNDVFCHLIWVCECLQRSCGHHFLVAASLQKHFDHIFSCLSCTRVTKERYQIGLLEGSLRSFFISYISSLYLIFRMLITVEDSGYVHIQIIIFHTPY